MFNEACKKITSAQNPLISHWTKVRTCRRYREENQTILLCGEKIILELLPKAAPKAILRSTDARERSFACPTYWLSEPLMKKVTGIAEGVTMAAEFPLPPAQELKGKKFILALDSIADPGNVGTLIRSALSFSWDGLFFLGACADLFNDKALRAARGGSLLMPYYRGSLEDLLSLKKPLFVADLQGESIKNMAPVEEAILLLSNEARGVHTRVKTLGKAVTIPMNPVMESLNVAIAGAILMYYLHA